MKSIFPFAMAASLALGSTVARADIVPGLEFYGDLQPVDAIDCAGDTTHSFRDFPAGNSYATNILGRACRVLHHVPANSAGKESGAYVSWRVGAGKNLVPNDPYLLVVDYPDDAPRSATLLNNGAPSRRGFHTGPTLGDSESPPYVMNFLESFNVPFSGTYQRIEQVMFPCEKPAPYNGGTRLSLARDGFDLTFALFPADDAPGSLGVAVASIRLYRITDESVLKAEINYPDPSLPRRVVTWREEMSDDNGHASYTDRMDFYRAKAKLMNVLAINTYSKDQLEFGYCQGWDPTYHGYGSSWYNWDDSIKNDWGNITQIMGAEDHWLLPYYEYAGARGKGNLGDQKLATPLKEGYSYSNASWVDDCRVDITSEAAKEDFKKVLDCTVLRYKDNAKFLGSWIRNRGQMPVSFHDNTVKLFCQETGRTAGSVTRASIASAGTSSAIYKEYRAWWYEKRAEFLEEMRQYLEDNGIENAKSFFTSTIAETGEYGINWEGMFTVNDTTVWQAACRATGQTRGNGMNVGYAAQTYRDSCLNADWPTWYPYEQEHAAPHDDPLTYTNKTNVALTYPFNRVFTVIWDQKGGANDWRDQNGDLFFVRFHSLNENNMMDTAGKELCGYFTADFEKAGPACMLSELWAMAISDPNMLGYLYGFNLARGFTQPARKFNQNFLSLPATKSEVVYGQGGHWGAALTIRKWTTPKGNYFAVINTSPNAYTNHNVGFAQYGGGTVYETVSHKAHALDGNGAIAIDIGPYEMIALTTVAPGTPACSVAATDVTDSSATISVDVVSLPGGSGRLVVETSTNAAFSQTVTNFHETVSATGTQTIALQNLAATTTYYVRATLTTDEGLSDTSVATFRTPTPATHPVVGTVSATDVGVTNATLHIAVTALGVGATSATATVRLLPNGNESAAKTFTLPVVAGDNTLPLAGLNSEMAYDVDVSVENNLGHSVPADRIRVTTAKIPSVPRGTGAWTPGLTQVKLGLPKSGNFDFTLDLLSYGDDVSDIVPGTLMSDVYVSNSYNGDPAVTNPWSGKSWRWAFDMIFAYGGEMYLKGGTTYNFFAAVDDGEGVVINGQTLLNKVSWTSTEGASYFAEKDGWVPVQFQFRNGNGGAGVINNADYNQWTTREMGFAWNTNGVTAQLPENAWSTLRDPGDGSLLRTRGTVPQLVTIPSPLFRNGSELVVPVQTELYDDDCTLYVYAGTSIPALNRAENWTKTAVVEAPDRAVSLRNVATGYTIRDGETVYAVARLVNERTGYDVSSDVAIYEAPPALDAPEFWAELSGAGFRDASFRVRLSAVGTGATTANLTLTVTPAAGGTSRTFPIATGVATFEDAYTTPFVLECGTAYKAVLTAENDQGRSSSTAELSFTTKASTAPEYDARSITASPTHSGLTLSIPVTSLGGGGTNLTARLTVRGPGGTIVHTEDVSAAAAGTVSFTVGSGLLPSTQYDWTVELRNENGKTATATGSFSTDRYPIALGEAVATVNEAGTAATLACPLLWADGVSATVSLTLNGAAVKTWTGLTGATDLSETVSIRPGSTNVFSFAATAGTDLAARADGRFIGTVYTKWFTVDFDGDTAYAAGDNWYAVPTDRGSWTVADGATSTLVDGGIVRTVLFTREETDGGTTALTYEPTRPSESGADVSVSGQIGVSVYGTVPSVDLIPDAKGAFCFVETIGITPYGLTADGWTPLAGGAPLQAGELVPYRIDFRFMTDGAPSIRYTAGSGWDSGWCPANDASARNISHVRFANSGEIGSFEGVYLSLQGGETIELVQPELLTDGTALSFGTDDATETFSMTIGNPVRGAYYTVYTAETLTGPFTAEKDSVLCDGTTPTFTLTVDASAPTKFAKIAISHEPRQKGDVLLP